LDEGRRRRHGGEDHEWHLVVLAPALREVVREEAGQSVPSSHITVHPRLKDAMRVTATEAARAGGRLVRPGQLELPLGLLVLRAQRGGVQKSGSGHGGAHSRPCARTDTVVARERTPFHLVGVDSERVPHAPDQGVLVPTAAVLPRAAVPIPRRC
jgi:hypothetical protein